MALKYLFCESKTGYLLNFIIYTGATTEYLDQPDPSPVKFDVYKSPSKVVLSLLNDYLHKGYCVTLDNYYTSPELTDALVSCDADCYGTLLKIHGLPNQYWEWKPKKGDPPKSQFKGEVGVMRWNDATKAKSDKFVSMLSTTHI